MTRRNDVQDATGRLYYDSGRGTLLATPGQAGSANTTTGVPTNGITGFAPGCIFINFLNNGTSNQNVYVNTGSFTSATWTAIA